MDHFKTIFISLILLHITNSSTGGDSRYIKALLEAKQMINRAVLRKYSA